MLDCIPRSINKMCEYAAFDFTDGVKLLPQRFLCVSSFYDTLLTYFCKQWDVEAAICTRTIESAHSLNVSAIDVGNDASTVYSGSRDYSVKAWDTETGVCKSEVSAPRNIVTALKFKSNNKLLFQGSEDLCVRVWDTRNSSKQPSMHINSFVYFPLSLALHPNENYFAAGQKFICWLS